MTDIKRDEALHDLVNSLIEEIGERQTGDADSQSTAVNQLRMRLTIDKIEATSDDGWEPGAREELVRKLRALLP